MNYTQILVQSNPDTPMAPDAGPILSGAYNDFPFANILTGSIKFSPSVCAIGSLALNGLGVATIANPEVFAVTAAPGVVVGVIFLVACD